MAGEGMRGPFINPRDLFLSILIHSSEAIQQLLPDLWKRDILTLTRFAPSLHFAGEVYHLLEGRPGTIRRWGLLHARW